jgi:hypothetical protein
MERIHVSLSGAMSSEDAGDGSFDGLESGQRISGGGVCRAEW